jgi:hypothetical protein
LGLKATNWPPEKYNPFDGTDLEQKYADRAWLDSAARGRSSA